VFNESKLGSQKSHHDSGHITRTTDVKTIITFYSCQVFTFFKKNYNVFNVFSGLWQCWFGVKKSIRPVEIEWWGVGAVISLERGRLFAYGPADATASRNSIISSYLNRDWFTFLVPAYPGCPGKEAVKRACIFFFKWYFAPFATLVRIDKQRNMIKL